MQRTILIILLVTSADFDGSFGSVNSDKIVGGTNTTIDHFPYQLSLGYHGGYFCGASIISDKWALTTAYCVYQRDIILMTLRAGSSYVNTNGTLYYMEDIVINQEYNVSTLGSDIVLVKINDMFEFGPDIQPILLPEQDESVPAGTLAVITGWGFTKNNTLPEILMQVEVSIIDENICKVELSRIGYSSIKLCAGLENDGRGTCYGDYGGPLVAHGRQIGIASGTYSDDCGAYGKPGLYTKVSEYRNWIKETTGI